MRWEIELPYPAGPPLSLNKRYGWQKRHRLTEQIHNDVALLLKYHKVPAMDHAWIWLDWQPAVKRPRDSDNPEPTRKAAIDQVVRSGLLEDDTPEFVTRPENVIRPAVKGRARLLLVIDNNYEGAA